MGWLARRARQEIALTGWPLFLFGCLMYSILVAAILLGLMACVGLAVTSFG